MGDQVYTRRGEPVVLGEGPRMGQDFGGEMKRGSRSSQVLWLRLLQARAGSSAFGFWGSGLGQPTFKVIRRIALLWITQRKP